MGATKEIGDVVELQEKLCSGSESKLMVGEKPMTCQTGPAVAGRLHRVGSEEPICSLVSVSASQGHVTYPCPDTTKSPQLVIPVIQQRPLCDTLLVTLSLPIRGGFSFGNYIRK